MEHMSDDGKQCNYTKQLDCALNKIKIWQEMYIVMAINTIVANAVFSLVISRKINLQSKSSLIIYYLAVLMSILMSMMQASIVAIRKV